MREKKGLRESVTYFTGCMYMAKTFSIFGAEQNETGSRLSAPIRLTSRRLVLKGGGLVTFASDRGLRFKEKVGYNTIT